MKQPVVTVFLCTGKDCEKRWERFCSGSPRKWLKRQVEESGLPLELRVVKTECMDQCDKAACLCLVHGRCAFLETAVRSTADGERLLAALRACVETSGVPL